MGIFKVTDMTCAQCEKVIKNELSRGNPDVKVEVSLKDKTVMVQNLSDDRVEFLLKEIGYTPEKMK
jgi:copper chaperone CopZ